MSLLFVCQTELTEFFAELTEFAAELSEFSLLKQYSRNSIPLVSFLNRSGTSANYLCLWHLGPLLTSQCLKAVQTYTIKTSIEWTSLWFLTLLGLLCLARAYSLT